MLDPIDWTTLVKQLGLLANGGEMSSSGDARRALEILIGEPAIRASVDHYITRAPGSELARSVLWLMRPWSAMVYCYDIWKSSRSIEDRRTAVELLRVVADDRALNWVGQFLEDADEPIQIWGAGVLDQLLWSNLVEPEEAELVLVRAENHSSAAVRERVGFIRGYLRGRACQKQENNDDEPPSNV
jgi:hypothetical protein